METPVFSIIIPIYNTPHAYFEKCIASLAGQTLPALEIILVDDGSDAHCAAACDRYAEGDARIRVLHQKNQGVSAARNNGVALAAADWVMFVDADDWVEPDTCERLYRRLQETDCDVLFFSGVKEYAQQQEKLIFGLQDGTLYDLEDVATREFLYRRAMGASNTTQGKFSTIYYCWGKVYRRRFLVENGIRFPVGVLKSEDKVFILLCLEKMGKLLYADQPYYHYRINEASVCNRYSDGADLDRSILAERLHTIAERMDGELSRLKDEPAYHRITAEYDRFVFGIISDVLLLKYFHKDYPGGLRKRCRDARAFIRKEPFAGAIRQCRYAQLPRSAKLKKFLLSHGWVGLFHMLKSGARTTKGRRAETGDA